MPRSSPSAGPRHHSLDTHLTAHKTGSCGEARRPGPKSRNVPPPVSKPAFFPPAGTRKLSGAGGRPGRTASRRPRAAGRARPAQPSHAAASRLPAAALPPPEPAAAEGRKEGRRAGPPVAGRRRRPPLPRSFRLTSSSSCFSSSELFIPPRSASPLPATPGNVWAALAAPGRGGRGERPGPLRSAHAQTPAAPQ